MAKLTYNILTDKVSWDCPNCQYINSFIFNVEEHLITTIVCEGCNSKFPLDPIRYEQFKKIQEVCGNALIDALGGEKIEKGRVEDGKKC